MMMMMMMIREDRDIATSIKTDIVGARLNCEQCYVFLIFLRAQEGALMQCSSKTGSPFPSWWVICRPLTLAIDLSA